MHVKICELGKCKQLCCTYLKLLTPDVRQTGRLGRAKQAPLSIFLDALHKQIRDPKPIEQVTGTVLFFARVFAQVEPVKDVRVPGLDVDGKGTGALVAALVDVASRGVVDAEHGDDAVGVAVGSRDVRALGLKMQGSRSAARQPPPQNRPRKCIP